jgi:hypothetical protein
MALHLRSASLKLAVQKQSVDLDRSAIWKLLSIDANLR